MTQQQLSPEELALANQLAWSHAQPRFLMERLDRVVVRVSLVPAAPYNGSQPKRLDEVRDLLRALTQRLNPEQRTALAEGRLLIIC